jgi:RNA polymerase sigma-70 factor (ECF subfamily)
MVSPPDDAPGPRPSSELDRRTLVAAQRGDRAARGAFIALYERRVTALVGRLLVSRPDLVDDAVQDVFVKLLTELHRFDPDGPARLSTWALTVATRQNLDRLRRLGTERRLLEAGEADEHAGPSGVRRLESLDLGARVTAAMAALPADHRAVLVLRAYHDLDYDEIAAALEIPVGTVKSRLGRAREALKRAIGGQP